MGSEGWGPVWDLDLRFSACGHTAPRNEVPYQKDTSSPYVCPVCGLKLDVDSPSFSSPDFVPSKELTWGLAKRTHARSYDDNDPNKVI